MHVEFFTQDILEPIFDALCRLEANLVQMHVSGQFAIHHKYNRVQAMKYFEFLKKSVNIIFEN